LRIAPYFAAFALLGGCNAPADKAGDEKAEAAKPAAAPTLDFADAAATSSEISETPALRAQVLLDHLGFSPGVIDGKEGESYAAALRGFQAANKLPESGRLDAATLAKLDQWKDVPATRVVVIPAGFAAGPFVPDFPEDAAAQAKLPALGYRNLMEALAERFHTTPEAIVALNTPETPVGAGKPVRVPNIPNAGAAPPGEDVRGWNDTLRRLGVSPDQPKAERIVVDKSEGVLKVYGAGEKLIAQFRATMGSSHDPLPIGDWKIQGVSRNPDFHYNPKLFWDVSNAKDTQLLKPGPNSPVGVVWLDLNKPHYGIHGTSEPQTIGRAESHGCIRLTNWDAARLAQMVKPGTPAKLQP
jgi:lipoprotein-anchoring transpeptidase ErfK/SrfK